MIGEAAAQTIMTSFPLSICIPTYNRAALLERTLAHLHGLGDLIAEIVVSDNASTDDTPAVVARWQPRLPALRYFRQRTNRGPLPNIHASLSLATSDFLFLLSDDDQLIPEAIVAALSTLAADPECVAVYGGYEHWNADLTVRHASLPPPFPGRYGRGDWVSLARNSFQLSWPVVRRAVFQRHCFLDDRTFGLWRLIGQLLNYGAIHLIAQPLYRHAETAGRMEQGVDEPWYHDFLRSDAELFVASIGRLEAVQMAHFVAARTIPIYLSGLDYARARNLPLLEHTFLMRYLSYQQAGGDADAEQRARTWETERLVAAVGRQLADQLVATPGLRRLVVETGRMNLLEMLDDVRGALPELEIASVEPEQIAALAEQTSDLLLVEYWDRITQLEAQGRRLACRAIAVADMIGRMRLRVGPSTPMLRGPNGSYHFSLW